MNSHERAAQLASFAIDFALSPDERRELDGHLGSCSSCRALVGGLRSDASSLKAIARHPAPLRLREAIANAGTSGVFGRSRAPALRLTWAVLLLGLLLAMLGVSLVLIGSQLPRTDRVAPLGLFQSATIRTEASVTASGQPLGGHPGGYGISGAAFGEGSVWVTSPTGVDRIDPSTNAAVATIKVGTNPERFAFGAGSVWVSVTGDGQVVRIDPGSNRVTARIPVGGQPAGITFADGSIWVAVRQDATLVRIDPTTDRVVATVPLPMAPFNVDATPGAIWLTADRGSGESLHSALLRVDPAHTADGATVVAASVASGGAAELVATTESVWFVVPSGVFRLDVATERITARIAVHQGTSGLAAGGGSIWAFSSAGFVGRIDPTTNTVADEVAVAVASDGAVWEVSGTYGAGAAWFRDVDAGRVIRVEGQ
jgi:YVTN family beta-propeller protein